ncbi:hypothetical protein BS47DRAFT_806548 [Hydnum rufescens UP504]|uniref:Uncharacterized protein n=1 Tax=Hydnum rufescens UP504 TaxID=1448309 RepID=A0A9P6DLQ7_9AGAM|nr:hypothetical protein BS47DRAFT_806548 [Hydnum rufescens UP504]
MFNIWCLFVWSFFGLGGRGMQICLLLGLSRTKSRMMEVSQDLLHFILQGNLPSSLMNIQHCRHHVQSLYPEVMSSNFIVLNNQL